MSIAGLCLSIASSKKDSCQTQARCSSANTIALVLKIRKTFISLLISPPNCKSVQLAKDEYISF